MEEKKKRMTYADAGVDLHSWHETRDRIGGLVKATYTDKVVGGFGQFGGMFDVSFLKEFRRPILVSSVDGVGTKLKIAFETGYHETIGEDIVNHCINDILVLGARPLFFLDYLGTGVLSADIAEQIVVGLSRACKAAGCVLIGGETAEMPGFYSRGEYDIAGTIIGAVDEEEIIDGRGIEPGDVIIGLRSNGLHTNGYSLARKIVTEAASRTYSDRFEPTGRTFGEELLRPHRSYIQALALMQRGMIKGCAHITGGGFQENIDRILPAGCSAVIETSRWRPEPVFEFLKQAGNVENDEMYRTFNMGVGMALAVGEKHAEAVVGAPELAAFEPLCIGRVESGNGTVTMEYC